MKKIFISLLLIAIAFTSATLINPSHASTTATLSVDSSTQQFPSAAIGDTIQVNLTVNNIQDLWAFDIGDLTFNPAVLNITSVSEGPFLTQTGSETLFLWTSNNPVQFSEGCIPDITDTLMATKGVSGTGVIATMSFTVLKGGTSEINFNETTFENSSPPSTGSSLSHQQISVTAIDAEIDRRRTCTNSYTNFFSNSNICTHIQFYTNQYANSNRYNN